MSERMIEIKRSIEKRHRYKKHIKEAFTFISELLGTFIMFAGLYFLIIFGSIIVDFIMH